MSSKKSSPDLDASDLEGSKSSLSGVAPSQYDQGSKNRITGRETALIKHRLVEALGRRKAEEVMKGLSGHLDRDGGSSERSVSAKEIDILMDTLRDNHYNGMDRNDFTKTREILDGYK